MTVLVSDSFNRANSTTGLGTTDSYNGGTSYTWSGVGSAVWGINSNQAYTPTPANDSPAYVNIGQSDQIQISVDIQTSSGIYAMGIAFRIQNSSNYFRVYASNTVIKIDRVINGSVTNIMNQSNSATAPFTLNVQLNGTTITAFVNSGTKYSVTDSNLQTQTYHGMYIGNSSSYHLDNFNISTLGTTGTNVALTSTVKSTSSATATANLTGSSNTNVPLSSTVKSSSNVTSAIKNTVAMVSSVKSNTNATATIKSSAALGSTVKSNTSVTSNVVNKLSLSSTVKSNTGTSNTIKNAVSLVATNKSNTSSTANISKAAQGSLTSVVKSNTSSSAKLGVLKPLSSTVKSSSASSGTVTNNKPISSTSKSSSSSSANLTVGFIFISSTTKSRTNSTVSAKSSLSLITNVKSRTTSHATASYFLYTGPPVIHKSTPLYGSRKLHENLNGSRKLHEQLGGYI